MQKRIYTIAILCVMQFLTACTSNSLVDNRIITETASKNSNLRPVETIVINDACVVMDLDSLEDITYLNYGSFAVNEVLYIKSRKIVYTPDEGDEERVADGFYVLPVEEEKGSFWEIPYACVMQGEAESQTVIAAAMYTNKTAVLEYSYWIKKTKVGSSAVPVDYLLTAYDTEMNILFSIDPVPLVTQRVNPYRPTDSEYEFGTEALYYGANGTLYMVTEFSVVAISPKGEKLYETGEGIYIHQSWRTADGRILVDYSIPAEGTRQYAYMDDEAAGFSAPVTLPDPGFENYTLYFGEGWDYYYQTPEGLHGMNDGDKMPTLLCRWSSTGVNPEKILNIVVIQENVYYCRTRTSSGTSNELLRRPSDDEIKPRTVITLGDSNNKLDYTDAVGRFNQTNTQYYIRIRDYQKQVAEGGNTLQEDILSGNAPDIVCSSSFTGTVTNLASKGTFVDLNTFLEKDSVFRENILGSVRSACTTNGKLYQLASTVHMSGMVGAAQNVPSVQEWNLDKYLTVNDECEQKGITLRHRPTREEMEQGLLYNNLATFMDYENAACSFDSEIFIQTIEYLKSLPLRENAPSTDIGELYKGLREGTILTYSAILMQFSDYLSFCVRFDSNDIVYLGSPTPNGGRPYLMLNHTYSITADSPVKEEAWAFVRYMLENGVNTMEFPVYKPLLQKEAQQQMNRYHLFSLIDTQYKNSTIEPEYDPQKKVMARLTEDHVAAVMDLLENRELYTTATAGSDATVKALIAEELSAFYAGNATAEDAARRIQSRVSIYLAEQS